MQRAKAFLFVCAGLFLLALSYHLGAMNATAQSGGMVEGASIESFQPNTFPRATGCLNRILYWIGEGGASHQYSLAPVPGSERIVATDPYGTVMLENGDWFNWNGTAWVLIGNLVGAPTRAQHETWGSVKTRYR